MSAISPDQPPAARRFVRDDVAYVLPMAVFLLFTQLGVWFPSIYPGMYIAKTIVVALMLIVLWPHYTRIRWNYWWLGAICGVVGVVQWVGMENLLLHCWPNYPKLHVDPYIPKEKIASHTLRTAFISVHWASATLMVPIMEELFWRDWLWRTQLAPNDMKLAQIGEPDWKVWLIVAAMFSCVHVQWMTATVWGLMIGGLLMYTRSLGACIVMHAVTNFLLGLYVLRTESWYLW